MKWDLPIALLVLSFILVGGCSEDDNPSSGAAKTIQTNTDAYYVAMAVAHSFKDLCPSYSSDWTYNGKTKSGVYGGSAKVSGSFIKTSTSSKTNYTFRTISINYSDYSGSTSAPALTGSASASGTISVSSSYSGNRYSGSWILNAYVTLSGTLSGSADVYVTWSTKYDWSARVKSNGQSWDVSNK